MKVRKLKTRIAAFGLAVLRSEEHTSELQSRPELLLLDWLS